MNDASGERAGTGPGDAARAVAGVHEALAGAWMLLREAGPAFADPAKFTQVMDRWGSIVGELEPQAADQLSRALEDEVEGVLRAMEAAGDRGLVEEDIHQIVRAESKPAFALATSTGAVIAANEMASERLGLFDGDLFEDSILPGRDLAALKQLRSGGGEGRRRVAVVKLEPADGLVALASVSAHGAGPRGAPETLIFKLFEPRLVGEARAIVREAYGLTEAETDVVRLMLEGLSTAQIAEERGASPQTVSKQIQSIYNKTGARRQTELVRAITSFLSSDAGEAAMDDGARDARSGYVMPRSHRIAKLPGGAEIEYLRVGPPDGRPVLVLHAALFGMRWPPAATRPLVDAGYTLWIPARPGYGRSTPLPQNASPEAEADRLSAFVDAMGLEEMRVVAQGVSAVPATAFAARRHNQVRSIAMVSGYVPVDLGAALKDMAPWQRAAIHTARTSPRLMRFFAGLGAKMMRQIGHEEFYRRVFATSESDQRVTRDPECSGLLQSSASLALAQSLEAFADDFRRAGSDWTETFDSARVPIAMIHGGEPQVFPPGRVHDFAESRSNVSLDVIDDAGQMIAYSHPEEMAKRLIQAFS